MKKLRNLKSPSDLNNKKDAHSVNNPDANLNSEEK